MMTAREEQLSENIGDQWLCGWNTCTVSRFQGGIFSNTTTYTRYRKHTPQKIVEDIYGPTIQAVSALDPMR